MTRSLPAFLLGILTTPMLALALILGNHAWSRRRWPKWMLVPYARRHATARLVKHIDAGIVVSVEHYIRPLAWIGLRQRWVNHRDKRGWFVIENGERVWLAPSSMSPDSSVPMLERLAAS